jgi:hypothetical protein
VFPPLVFTFELTEYLFEKMKLPPRNSCHLCYQIVANKVHFSDFEANRFYIVLFFFNRRKFHPDQKNINAYVVFKDESAATKALKR